MAAPIRIAQIKITELSQEGHGRGIWYSESGIPHLVEVPFSIPGDEIQVRLLKRKKGIYQSQPQEWLQYSSDRMTPRCLHFGSCGGCRWQHMAYEQQLEKKEAWIRRLLSPYLHQETVWYPIIPCSPPWYYRNKMEFTFSSDKAGKRYLGLFLYGMHGRVFQIHECHLAQPWMIKAVEAVSQWWTVCGLDAYHGGSDRGSLRTLTLREGQHTGDRMVMLTVSGNPEYAVHQKHLKQFVASLKETIQPTSPDQKLSIFLRIQQIAKGKPTQFYEMLLDGPDHIREVMKIEITKEASHSLKFRISPTAFFQPNTRQAEQLYSRALQLTPISADSIVYDLYCGTGTLGICMAHQAKEVIGIELSPESSLDARENAKYNQLSNFTIQTGDVGQLLPQLLVNSQCHPAVIMLDPPRAGLDAKALQHLLAIKAPHITYISCNPVTQAANLEVLTKGGYRLKAIQPIDQFPQTIHVENIVTLTLC